MGGALLLLLSLPAIVPALRTVLSKTASLPLPDHLPLPLAFALSKGLPLTFALLPVSISVSVAVSVSVASVTVVVGRWALQAGHHRGRGA